MCCEKVLEKMEYLHGKEEGIGDSKSWPPLSLTIRNRVRVQCKGTKIVSAQSGAKWYTLRFYKIAKSGSQFDIELFSNYGQEIETLSLPHILYCICWLFIRVALIPAKYCEIIRNKRWLTWVIILNSLSSREALRRENETAGRDYLKGCRAGKGPGACMPGRSGPGDGLWAAVSVRGHHPHIDGGCQVPETYSSPDTMPAVYVNCHRWAMTLRTQCPDTLIFLGMNNWERLSSQFSFFSVLKWIYHQFFSLKQWGVIQSKI